MQHIAACTYTKLVIAAALTESPAVVLQMRCYTRMHHPLPSQNNPKAHISALRWCCSAAALQAGLGTPLKAGEPVLPEHITACKLQRPAARRTHWLLSDLLLRCRQGTD